VTTPTITTAGLQQTGGAEQEITSAGMAQWIANVNGFRVSNAGKKRLFTASRADVISTSRRAVD
jgi:hypothetical protein